MAVSILGAVPGFVSFDITKSTKRTPTICVAFLQEKPFLIILVTSPPLDTFSENCLPFPKRFVEV